MSESPLKPMLKAGDRRRLKRHLKRDLGRSERFFVLLRLYERLSVEQAGEFLGMTAARAKEVDYSLTMRAEVEERERRKIARLRRHRGATSKAAKAKGRKA